MSMALFRRLDPAATGLVHQDQARLALVLSTAADDINPA